MKKNPQTIGRAKTVLVFHHGGETTAAITSVIAEVTKEPREERIQIVGPAGFDPKLVTHLHRIILPLVDTIAAALQLPQSHFTLSAVNLGAASSSDIGFSVSGYSADAPIFLALLSAALHLPIRQDAVSTGHIASTAGDIAFVSSIPAKLDAVLDDDSLHAFVYPELTRDSSLERLAPNRRQQTEDALTAAKGKVKLHPVSNVKDLLQAMCSDEAVIQASLASGFFSLDHTPEPKHTPYPSLVSFLLYDHETRFWSALERNFLERNIDQARDLLQARMRFHVETNTYPEAFGIRLLRLIQSLPPYIRRLKAFYPLAPISRCIQLGQSADEKGARDVQWLIKAVTGDGIGLQGKKERDDDRSPEDTTEQGQSILNSILDRISEKQLTESIAIPADSALVSFTLDRSIVDSIEEFNRILYSFYLHLQRYTHSIPVILDEDQAGADAQDLLDQTFGAHGGVKAAHAEALDGCKGGIRWVLEHITNRYKQKEKEKWVNKIFKDALDPMQWEEKVRLIEVLLKRLAPFLPPDIRDQPPERFALHTEILVQAYVQSLDQFMYKIRSL